jgi:hypothetical protein
MPAEQIPTEETAFTRAGLLRFAGPAGQLVGMTLGELPDRPLLLGPGVPLRGA